MNKQLFLYTSPAHEESVATWILFKFQVNPLFCQLLRILIQFVYACRTDGRNCFSCPVFCSWVRYIAEPTPPFCEVEGILLSQNSEHEVGWEQGKFTVLKNIPLPVAQWMPQIGPCVLEGSASPKPKYPLQVAVGGLNHPLLSYIKASSGKTFTLEFSAPTTIIRPKLGLIVPIKPSIIKQKSPPCYDHVRWEELRTRVQTTHWQGTQYLKYGG